MSPFGIQASVMVHVLFGVLGILLAVALLVYILNLNEKNIPRIRSLSLYTAVSIALSYIIGGWWYVVYYMPERDIIRAGAWKWRWTSANRSPRALVAPLSDETNNASPGRIRWWRSSAARMNDAGTYMSEVNATR